MYQITYNIERPEALGKIGMCFGFGMMAGSIIGGWLQSSYGERVTVLASAIGTIINLILTAISIPKNTKMYSDNDKSNPPKGCQNNLMT